MNGRWRGRERLRFKRLSSQSTADKLLNLNKHWMGSGCSFNLLPFEVPGYCHSYFDRSGHELIMRISGVVVIPCLSHSCSILQQLQSVRLWNLLRTRRFFFQTLRGWLCQCKIKCLDQQPCKRESKTVLLSSTGGSSVWSVTDALKGHNNGPVCIKHETRQR